MQKGYFLNTGQNHKQEKCLPKLAQDEKFDVAIINSFQ